MQNKSHGVSSCICVETNVIKDIKNIKVIYRLRAIRFES